MRLSSLLLFLSIAVSISASQPTIVAFGSRLTYDQPDTNAWSLEQNTTDEEMHRGVIMYKRATVYDADGIPVQPVVAIIYEKLADTTDAVTYSITKRISSPLRWKVRRAFAPDSTEYGNAIFYEGEYDNQDIKHILIIGHATQGLIGIQAIGDATESVFAQVESDMNKFVHSIRLTH